MKTKPTIFLTISHGWHSRLLIKTNFLKELMKNSDFRVVLLSPNANEIQFRKECGVDNNVIFEEVTNQTFSFSARRFLFSHFEKIRRNLFINGNVPETITLRRRQWFYRSRLGFLIPILNHLMLWFPPLGPLFVKLYRFLFPDHNFKGLFRKYNPDLLVVLSTAHYLPCLLMKRAYQEGVPIVYIVESWDNPTCKGSFHEPIYKYIVWNEINKNELINYHGACEKDIYVTGSAYHDIYANYNGHCTREMFAARYGLDPKKKIIIVAGTADIFYPQFDEFMDILIDALDSQKFDYPCQVLIRPHPQVIAGQNEGKGVEDLKYYSSLSRNVFFSLPNIVSKKLIADVEQEDINRLAEIVYHGDVVISFGSTVTIDACIVNTPVILVGFDGYKNLPYLKSARIWLDNVHHRNVIESHGVKIAYSPKEFIAQVNQYLADPTIDRERRMRVAQEQAFLVDGNSARRMAGAVEDCLAQLKR